MTSDERYAQAAEEQYIQDRLAFPRGTLGFRQAIRAKRDLDEVWFRRIQYDYIGPSENTD